MKNILIVTLILLVLIILGYFVWNLGNKSELIQEPQTPALGLSEAQARAIAEQNCIKGGDLNATKPGCNPACVVSESTKTAEINWRCTGAVPPVDNNNSGAITNFEQCAAAGNPIMESYPRRCNANGQTFTEQIVQGKTCTADERKADLCAEIFDPVCALVQIQCIKAPCNPVKQTFSNSCEACKNQLVQSYTAGACE